MTHPLGGSGGIMSDMVTSKRQNFRRVKVEVAETAFHEGRQFRSRFKFSLASSGGRAVVKVVVPLNVLIKKQVLTCNSGTVLYRTYALPQGTESTGDWVVMPTVFNDNTMSEAQPYTRLTEVYTGGSFTPTDGDNTVALDEFVLKNPNATSQQSSIGGGTSEQRGVGVGTYYLTFTAQANTTEGYLYMVFEERP